MSDKVEPIVIDDGSGGDRPLVIPPELRVLPLRDRVVATQTVSPTLMARYARYIETL